MPSYPALELLAGPFLSAAGAEVNAQVLSVDDANHFCLARKTSPKAMVYCHTGHVTRFVFNLAIES